MIVINTSTRQFNIPGADMTFGVEADAGSERKYFQCPRYVGNNLDLMGSFVRLNYRNANGEVDSYLVEDMTVDGENVLFSWELSPKVTAYKGQIRFVLCVVGPDTKVAWHTTLGTGVVLEGLEPEAAVIQNGTVDVVAQLIAMVNQQTGAVEAEGANQIKAVQTAAQAAQSDAVAQIEAKGVNVRESIPDDYTSLENTVDSLVRGRAGAIVCSAEGSAVTVNDASDMKMQGIKIFGRSTQNGVPTPDAPMEIKSVVEPVVTVCGKNLLPYPYIFTTFTKDGVTVTANADGTITVNGTTSANVWVGITESVVLPAGTYTLSIFPDDWVAENGYVLWQGKNTHTGTIVATIPEATSEGVGVVLLKGVTYSNVILRPQIESGSVATGYEPHRGGVIELTHTLPGIPVTSGGNYTDSDGQQWISDEVDLERGVYVQRVKSVTYDGSESFALSSDGVFNRTCSDAFEIHEGNQVSFVGVMCDSYEAKSWVDISAYKKVGCALRWGTGVGIYDNRYTTTDEFNAHLTEKPVTIIYLLAKPIETPLSETEIAAYRALHSNYPNTTVLNDAGAHMVVKYAADTKLYIDNKIKEVLG